MKRFLFRLAAVVLLGIHVALIVVVWRASDPRYKFAELLALGRFDRFDTVFREAAEPGGLDPLLLKAVAWKASRFDPGAVAGSRRGLLLVEETAAREWAAANGIESFMYTDLFDAHVNARAGAWLLARSIRRWSGRDDPLAFALAEFHAGSGAIARSAGVYATAAGMLRAMPGETRDFVAGVLLRLHQYQAAH